tara:strand:+ start:361 stop:483 length:123 start_codon:yes stop_codon:yes gene_type:complete
MWRRRGLGRNRTVEREFRRDCEEGVEIREQKWRIGIGVER